MAARPPKTNIVLIGMPGSGKSTVGVLLAKRAAMSFVDTDLLIQASEGRSLQSIVDADGYEVLRQIEERVLLAIDLKNHVIATGGSAVYSERAMTHLGNSGTIVFLDVSLATVEARIGDFSMRGISRRVDQSIAELFEERYQLYKRFADITIAGNARNQEEVCRQILQATGLES